MKRLIIITACLLLLCGAIFYFISIPRDVSVKSSEAGVLDLTGEDFGETLYNLHGEWEFYFGELIPPGDFADGGRPDGAFIKTPMSWNDAGYPLTGCATYRLTLKTDEPGLVMYIPEICEASVIFVNGEKVYECGKPGATKAESVPGVNNAFADVRAEDGVAEIVAWVSNYNWMQGGIASTIIIGEKDALTRFIFMRLSALALFIGVFLMAGTYHIILYTQRRKDRPYLFFALICLITSVRFFMETNALVQFFSERGMGVAHYHIYIALLILSSGMLAVFTHSVFGIPYGKVKAAVYGVTTVGLIIIPFIFPFTSLPLTYSVFCLIPMIVAGVSAIRRKELWNNPYYALYLISLFIFVIWAPFTKLAMNDAYFVPGVASNMFLMLSQCIMLSVGYAETKRREDELSIRTKALESIDHMKTELMATISHETMTPLAVLSVYSEIVAGDLREQGVDEQTAMNLDVISEETQRIKWLMEELQSHAERKDQSLPKTRLNLVELMENAVRLYAPILERKRVRFDVSLPDVLPDVYACANEVTQVFFNLLQNSRKATEDGSVGIAAERDGGFIRVSVSDTGCGIPEELLPRIFERGTVGNDGGKGLGLSICREIIKSHGGEIHIESRQGEGTTVRFTLPVWDEEAHHG